MKFNYKTFSGVIEESFDKTSTDFEVLPDNQNISIKNENIPNSLESLPDDNELNELLNDEVEADDFMKLFSELEKLSYIPLPSADISNIPLPSSEDICNIPLPSENICNIPLPSEDMKKFTPIVEYNQIHKPTSHKTTEDIKSIIKTDKMSDMEKVDVDNLVLKLLPIFPDACPNFLRDFCRGRKNNPTELEQIIMHLITSKNKSKFSFHPAVKEWLSFLCKTYRLTYVKVRFGCVDGEET